MYKITALLIFSLAFKSLIAQVSDYDSKINEVSEKISGCIINENKIKVVVGDIINTENPTSKNVLSSWVASDVSNYLAEKSNKKYKVVNRDDMAEILKQNKIEVNSGIYDKATIQKISSATGADILILGKLSTWEENFKLTLTGLDANSPDAEILCTSTGVFNKTQDLEGKFNTEVGFTSLLPDEDIKQIDLKNKSQDPNCYKNNAGDYCFNNKSNNIDWKVILKEKLPGNAIYGAASYKGGQPSYGLPGREIVVRHGETQCFIGVPVNIYDVEVKRVTPITGNEQYQMGLRGTQYPNTYNTNLTVKKCETQTHNINP